MESMSLKFNRKGMEILIEILERLNLKPPTLLEEIHINKEDNTVNANYVSELFSTFSSVFMEIRPPLPFQSKLVYRPDKWLRMEITVVGFEISLRDEKTEIFFLKGIDSVNGYGYTVKLALIGEFVELIQNNYPDSFKYVLLLDNYLRFFTEDICSTVINQELVKGLSGNETKKAAL